MLPAPSVLPRLYSPTTLLDDRRWSRLLSSAERLCEWPLGALVGTGCTFCCGGMLIGRGLPAEGVDERGIGLFGVFCEMGRSYSRPATRPPWVGVTWPGSSGTSLSGAP